jgi:hypothetical protein
MSEPMPHQSGMALLALCIDAARIHVDDNEVCAVGYVVERVPFVDREAVTVLVRSVQNLIFAVRP